MADYPAGFYINDMVVWGRSLSRETYVAKGIQVEVEDMRSASFAVRAEFDRRQKRLFALLGEDHCLQVQWGVDNDYRDMLNAYHSATLAHSGDVDWTRNWTTFIRQERYIRYTQFSPNIRRERLTLWVSRKCNSLPKEKRGFWSGLFGILFGKKRAQSRTLEETETFFAQQARSFDQIVDQVRNIFGDMASVTPMDDYQNFLAHKRFLTPSLNDLPNADEICQRIFDPDASIMENVLPSDGIMTKDSDGNICFLLDGYYHTLMVLRRWPQTAYSGIMGVLTNALGKNFTISQNIYPKSIQAEINKGEKDHERLVNESKKKVSSKTKAEHKAQQLMSLANGDVQPFNVLTIIRIWAHTIPELQAMALRLKTAAANMNGSQLYQVQYPAQAKNLFFETLPGYLGGSSRKWDIHAESSYLSMLMPFSNVGRGRWRQGEIIMDGPAGNLVGIETFVNNTPQNAVFVGTSGAGKSVAMTDILSQNCCFVDYTVIIEEGLTYATMVQAMGGSTIIITPDCGYCFNYLDTQGLPLSAEHAAIAASLNMIFVGASEDQEKNQRRQAMIGEYVQDLYNDTWEDYKRADDKRYWAIAREAMVIELHRRNSMPQGSTLLDAFCEIRDLKSADPDEYTRRFDALTEEEVIAFARDVGTERIVRNVGFSHFKPQEFPTHSALVEQMRNPKSRHPQQEVADIATMLREWSREGSMAGGLFDGVSTIDLHARVLHFELGRISEANATLKQAAGFLIANYVRQHIVAMPRAIRKQMVIEEVVRFLDVPGGKKILEELYGQLRKYMCWVICVTQQYEKLRVSSIRSVIFGNTKMAFIAKQRDPGDVAELAGMLKLSESAQEAIKNFVMPEHQFGKKYCDFVVSIESNGRAMSYVARLYAAPEMVYAARSDGEVFDKRQKQLLAYPNPYIGILEEVAKSNSKSNEKSDLSRVA